MKQIMLAILFVLAPLVAGAEELKSINAKPADELVKWQDSEAGQFVFFAVLEGLYRDGVPNEVVDLIVNPKREMDSTVKHVFVFQCDICHAAYEAFVLYSRRQTFQKSGERNTFGKSFDPKILGELKSNDARTRVYALGSMIRPWIAARVDLLKLSKEKQEELVATLLKFKGEANTKLSALRQSDPLYKDWIFYGGCQACEAATNIAKNWRKQ
jgi:hypothetical protein